jgi:hypothetical protein
MGRLRSRWLHSIHFCNSSAQKPVPPKRKARLVVGSHCAANQMGVIESSRRRLMGAAFYCDLEVVSTCANAVQSSTSSISEDGQRWSKPQYMRGDSHFSPFGECLLKNQFADYLPTLRLAGWHYSEGVKIPWGEGRTIGKRFGSENTYTTAVAP